jgi:predicted nucleic acid-binding protein
LVTLVDTSALYAYLDERDANHTAARDAFRFLLDAGARLATHNYVVVESCALVGRRLGALAVRSLLDDVLPVIEIRFVNESIHRMAVAAMLGSVSRAVSLVDWTSFVMMREQGIEQALAFDADFTQQGFTTVPGPVPEG